MVPEPRSPGFGNEWPNWVRRSEWSGWVRRTLPSFQQSAETRGVEYVFDIDGSEEDVAEEAQIGDIGRNEQTHHRAFITRPHVFDIRSHIRSVFAGSGDHQHISGSSPTVKYRILQYSCFFATMLSVIVMLYILACPPEMPQAGGPHTTTTITLTAVLLDVVATVTSTRMPPYALPSTSMPTNDHVVMSTTSAVKSMSTLTLTTIPSARPSSRPTFSRATGKPATSAEEFATGTEYTTSTIEGFASGSDMCGNNVRLATVETRRSETVFPVPGAHGWSYENLGANHQWEGMHTKVVLYRKFVRRWADICPDVILILMDGGDVGFGGCEKDEMLARYMSVVDAGRAKAPVVAGGDSSIWPHALRADAAKYAYFAPDRMTQLHTFGFNASIYTPYQLFGLYEYVNSGFMMGPASTLELVLNCMGELGWMPALARFDDQFALTKCMFSHPDKITVDYSGVLVLDMLGFSADVLHAHRGVMYNRATNKSQCFVHGNGKSYPLSSLENALRTGARDPLAVSDSVL